MICFMIKKQINFYRPVYTGEDLKGLYQFSFNMPLKGAEMNGLDRLLCASTTCAIRKGLEVFIGMFDQNVNVVFHNNEICFFVFVVDFSNFAVNGIA